MRKAIPLFLALALVLGYGCSGISRVTFSRFDRGRKVIRVAVIAQNKTKADRYKMWAWTKKRPRIVPRDVFAEEIATSLTSRVGSDFHILSPKIVDDALKRMGVRERAILSPSQLRTFRRLTGADVVLFANVSFYLQNYLFLNTLGVVEISMRMVGTYDGALLWEAKGRNVGLFMSTDRALEKLREKMVAQAARKLEQDRSLAG